MQKIFLITTAFMGLTAVILGAFGAHGLRPMISTENLAVWEKGVQYQFYHTLALFMCYLYLRQESSNLVTNAGVCFIVGIVCFSGSLYLLATRELTNVPTAVIGPVTPIGGLFFIAGWGLLLIQAVKRV